MSNVVAIRPICTRAIARIVFCRCGTYLELLRWHVQFCVALRAMLDPIVAENAQTHRANVGYVLHFAMAKARQFEVDRLLRHFEHLFVEQGTTMKYTVTSEPARARKTNTAQRFARRANAPSLFSRCGRKKW